MSKVLQVKGKIISGSRRASYFTQLPWVQKQCLDKLGFKPYPGTLNLQVDEKCSSQLAEIKKQQVLCLIPPENHFCTALVLPALVKDVQSALILPSQEVSIHEQNVLEILAPVKLKEVLGLKDGDCLSVCIEISS